MFHISNKEISLYRNLRLQDFKKNFANVILV